MFNKILFQIFHTYFQVTVYWTHPPVALYPSKRQTEQCVVGNILQWSPDGCGLCFSVDDGAEEASPEHWDKLRSCSLQQERANMGEGWKCEHWDRLFISVYEQTTYFILFYLQCVQLADNRLCELLQYCIKKKWLRKQKSFENIDYMSKILPIWKCVMQCLPSI